MEQQVFNEVYKGDMVKRLGTLGYDYSEERDEFTLKFVSDKVEMTIINTTNQSAVLDELYFVFIERVCGEFFIMMKGTNKLSEEQMEVIVKSISEGDTSVTFDDKSTVQAIFETYINKLLIYGESEIIGCRKLRW